MTANSVNLQVNQNIQFHPKEDPNIDFYHTFEVFLPTDDSTVHIMNDHENIGRIASMSFWNSAQHDDPVYTINTLDMTDPSHPERDVEVMRNPLLKSFFAKDHKIFNEGSNISLFQIQGKKIPELAKDHKIKHTPVTEFDFLNFPDFNLNLYIVDEDDNCQGEVTGRALTVQAKGCSSCKKIDLPSRACAHDNDKIKCSKFGCIRTIEKPEGSDVYYMTITRDKEKNYKFYFSDKDGNKTNDLELSLNDVRIKEPNLLKLLECKHHTEKLQKEIEGINDHLREKRENDDAVPSTTEVAELLLGSKGRELGNTILHAIANNDGNAGTALSSQLAGEVILQLKVADELVNGSNLNLLSTAVAEKSELQTRIANELRANPGNAIGSQGERGSAGPNTTEVVERLARDATLQSGVANKLKEDQSFQEKIIESDDFVNRILIYDLVDTKDRQPKKLYQYIAEDESLKTGIKDELTGDPNFKNSVKGETGTTGPRGISGQDGISPTADEVASKSVLQAAVANNSNFRTNVKDLLKADQAFKIDVKGETGPAGPRGIPATPESVATELLKPNKVDDLTQRLLLKGIIDSGDRTHTPKILADKVKEKLAADPKFKNDVRGDPGPRGANGISPTAEFVADELLHPSKDALIHRLMFNEIVNPGGDIDNTPKTLADRVKEKLVADQAFKNSVKGDGGGTGPVGPTGPRGNPGPQGPEGARGRDANPAEVANKLVTTKASELGRAVLDAEKSEASGRPISTAVTYWAVSELKGSADFQTEVATKLVEDQNKLAQIGYAVLNAEESSSNHPISTIVTPWIVDSLERSTDSIQKYEEQVKKIEARIEDEEREILKVKEIATKKADESARNAQKSEAEANRSKTAADESEGHAERSRVAADRSEGHAHSSETAATTSAKHAKDSKDAAELSKNHANESKSYAGRSGEAATTSAEHATRSETAAGKSEGHEQNSKIAADKSKEHAQRSEVEADRSEDHSGAALASSVSAANYVSNIQEIVDSITKGQQGSLSRPRRGAIEQESDSSESQVFQYDDSGFTYSPTDSDFVV